MWGILFTVLFITVVSASPSAYIDNERDSADMIVAIALEKNMMEGDLEKGFFSTEDDLCCICYERLKDEPGFIPDDMDSRPSTRSASPVFDFHGDERDLELISPTKKTFTSCCFPSIHGTNGLIGNDMEADSKATLWDPFHEHKSHRICAKKYYRHCRQKSEQLSNPLTVIGDIDRILSDDYNERIHFECPMCRKSVAPAYITTKKLGRIRMHSCQLMIFKVVLLACILFFGAVAAQVILSFLQR